MSYNQNASWQGGGVQQSNGTNVNFVAYPQLNRNSRHQEQHWNQAPSSNNNNNSYQTSTNFEQFDNSASSFSRKQPYEGGGNDNNQPYVYNAIGTITQIADSGGLVNDEIVFYRSAVRGDMPLLGSRVLFEAVIHNDPDQPYKWIAKRIQLMTPHPDHKGGNGVPALGTPGGRDDPRRVGLSGSGCKWYLRYLQNGLNPEAARKKAEEHRNKTDANAKNRVNSISSKNGASTKSNVPQNSNHEVKVITKQTTKNIMSGLPALGTPGGRDDPLRAGLSGSGCKWYLRYLQNGLKPEAARKKAEEHRNKTYAKKRVSTTITPQIQHKHNQATTLLHTEHKKEIQPKSGVKREIPPEVTATITTEPDAKKARCSAATTFSELLAGDIIVAVVDKGCSDGRISRERWQKVEARLTKIFLSILKEHPGSVPCCNIIAWYQDHVKFIACADQRSVDLFKIAIASIGEAWPDAKLELVSCNQIPSQLKARATIPGDLDEAQEILDIIQESNPQLHTSNWRVKRLDDSKAHIRTAIFAVDTESLVSLAVTGGVIKYGFTFITLCDFEVFFDENVAETLNMSDQTVIEIDSVSEQSPNSKQIPVEVDDSVPEQVDSNAQPLPGSMPETLTITLDNIKKEADLDLVEKDDSVDEHNLDDKKADHDIEEIDDSEHNPNNEADSVADQDIAEQNDSIPEQGTSTEAP